MLGALFTNGTVAVTTVTSAQVYKALEPIFVVIILFFMFPKKFKQELNVFSLLSLVTVVSGVILASKSSKFSLIIVIFASLANVFFGVRTVLVKDVQKSKKEQESQEENDLENLLPNQSNESQEREQSKIQKLDVYEIFGSCCLIGFLSCSILLFSALIFKENINYNLTIISNLFSPQTLMSGLCYFAYNLLSFMVLANVTAASHALLKNGKRISILIGAAVFLNEQLTLKLWFGVYLAVVGMLFYSLFKSHGVDKPFGKEIWQEGFRRVVLATAFIGVSILLTSWE